MTRSLSCRLLMAFILLTGTLYSRPVISATPEKRIRHNSSISPIEENILYYVNEYRRQKGLPALQMITAISLEAEKHSLEMATNKTPFGHDGFEDRVKLISKKIGVMQASAENVAYGNLSPKEVVDIWMKSPGHRKNIEGNFKLTGIGISATKDNVIFFTQIFIR